MLVIRVETGGQDSSPFPQAFNYQPLSTRTKHFRFFSFFSKFNSSVTCRMPDAHLLGTHLQFVCFLSLLKTWLSVGALLAKGAEWKCDFGLKGREINQSAD